MVVDFQQARTLREIDRFKEQLRAALGNADPADAKAALARVIEALAAEAGDDLSEEDRAQMRASGLRV